jgi:hypothetical protein
MLPPDGIPRFLGDRSVLNAQNSRPFWFDLVAMPFVIFVGWLLWGAIVFGGAFLLQLLERNFGLIFTQIAFVIGTLFLGTTLYALRCRKLRLYSKFEFAVGVWGAVYAVNVYLAGTAFSSASAQPSSVLAFVGALYIIVRAYDNYYKAIEWDFTRKVWNKRFFGKDTNDKLA